jgi:hypothetical protein
MEAQYAGCSLLKTIQINRLTTGMLFCHNPGSCTRGALARLSISSSLAGIPAIHHWTITPEVRLLSKGIKIHNPVSGHGFTTKNRAARFVAQGRAVWVEPGVSIRFVAVHPQHVAAKQSANATRYWYARAVQSGMAGLNELANLPMITPAKALGLGKRKGASRHTFLATQEL